MEDFQRLLETPFRWLASLAAPLVRRVHALVEQRREQALRRKFMNG